MASSDGVGVEHATVQNTVFDGLSRHFNDYGVSLYGNTNGGHIKGNLFRIRGEGRRHALTIENRTGEVATVSLDTDTGIFTLNGATLTLVSGDLECSETGVNAQCTGWTSGDLCNFVNSIRTPGALPGSQFRCALRESTRANVLFDYEGFDTTIAPGPERFIMYYEPSYGDFHHGSVMASTKWATLILPTNPLDLLETAGWQKPPAAQMSNARWGFGPNRLRSGDGFVKSYIYPIVASDGSPEYRIMVRQSGQFASSPYSSAGGWWRALVFTRCDSR